jgi:hypothetical protein
LVRILFTAHELGRHAEIDDASAAATGGELDLQGLLDLGRRGRCLVVVRAAAGNEQEEGEHRQGESAHLRELDSSCVRCVKARWFEARKTLVSIEVLRANHGYLGSA